MKKRILSLLFAIVMMAAMLPTSVSAMIVDQYPEGACTCGGNTSSITYSITAHTDTEHLYAPSCPVHGKGYSETHRFSNGVCTVCGYDSSGGGTGDNETCVHEYQYTYDLANRTGHEKSGKCIHCSATTSITLEAHTFTDGVCVCGYTSSGTIGGGTGNPETCVHQYQYTYSPVSQPVHAKSGKCIHCSATARVSLEAHTYTDGVCVCGYESSGGETGGETGGGTGDNETCVHEYQYTYDLANRTGHEKSGKCIHCSAPTLTTLEEHTFTDGVCVCGYTSSGTIGGGTSDNETCVHEYQYAYATMNQSVHRKFDKCIHCPVEGPSILEAHTYTDGVCVCGYTYSGTIGGGTGNPETCVHQYQYAYASLNQSVHRKSGNCIHCSATARVSLEAHTFTDGVCVCGATEPVAVCPEGTHVFDNDCDADCNVCGTPREVGDHISGAAYPCVAGNCIHCSADMPATANHSYDNDCDADCNVCGTPREVGDHISGAAYPCVAGNCIHCSANVPATANHVFDNNCDADCNVCGTPREVGAHISGAAYPCVDGECIHCSADMPATANHSYDNVCDADCNNCGAIREVGDHVSNSGYPCMPGSCIHCGAGVPAADHELGENGHTCTVCGGILSCGDGYHWYHYNCDKTCHQCGEETRPEADHQRNDRPACSESAECVMCGLDFPPTIPHTDNGYGTCTVCNANTYRCEYGHHTTDGQCDADCNLCGAAVETYHVSSNWACKNYCVLCEAPLGNTADHNYECQVAVDPTCGEDGYYLYTCMVCDEYYELTPPASGNHTSNAAYPCQDGECIYCGGFAPAGDHLADGWPCLEQWCTWCGEDLPLTAEHEYDNVCDDRCNVCDEWREVGPHLRPEGVTPCAVVECLICGERDRGIDCDRGETPVCTPFAPCIYCGQKLPAKEHAYADGVITCGPGECIYCGVHFEMLHFHSPTAWVDCLSSLCNHGCGMLFPATADHVDADDSGRCDVCNSCMGEHTPRNACEYDYCTTCWNKVVPEHNYEHECDMYCANCGETNPNPGDHSYDNDCDVDCNACGTTREVGDHVSDAAYPCAAGNCIHCGVAMEAERGHCYEYECSANCLWCGAVNPNPSDHTSNAAYPCQDGECIYCGGFAPAGDHLADGWPCLEQWCTWCGEDLPLTAEHKYDSNFDVHCNVCGALREVDILLDMVGVSISEDVNGLAMAFSAKVEGITFNGNRIIYDNATIGGEKLIGMGAVVSNNYEEVAYVPDLEDVDGIRVLNAPAVNAYDYDEATGTVYFAIRVINIPDEYKDRMLIYSLYFIYENDAGEQEVCYSGVWGNSYNDAASSVQ